MKDKLSNPKFLAQLALLVAVELVMKITGLGSVPIGPIYMSFLTLPVAIGAILMGPLAGAILGGVFGIASFVDAISGASAMGGVLFQVAPFKTFVLCVITRIFMGFLAGVVFKIVNKIFRGHTIAYSIGAISAPLLNTLFFMGFLVIAFYDTDYIQKLAHTIGATNPLTFVITLVGLQGLIEAVTCCILGTVVSKALAKHLGHSTAGNTNA
ncbi:ECF transporter S component [Mogibacterium diversum]|jgi:predicted membrane protein|uniref:ECF transporter S component n=1 Tax=Mogibacterium diversum TaxID=114527 RepID=UPI001CAAF46F|nr:ECF transporter S component [Mogibacterium diversum]MBF1319235.1 ECF transporter S component [Mogibacterium diversum]MBF1322678.1 ECF transporter S component [Mogibacterium diversum]MBF1341317.1 ECF transporter S component [Mogibacterium diversum]